MNLRAERVAEQMKKDIAEIIKEDIKDPRVGFVSVTRVEVSSDLRHARVYVSIFGDEQAQKECLEALGGASGFIRKEIGRRIKLKCTPEIVFRIDHSIEHGARIHELLTKVSEHGAE